MKKILLFDVDGTSCESGKIIDSELGLLLNYISLDKNVELGIVGGGTFNKIIYQLNNSFFPKYIFSECGSVYHKLIDNQYYLVHSNNIRLEPEYKKINILVKKSLKFISTVDYLVSGNFIDLRNGLIYISLVGMSANDDERNEFIKLDKINNYRLNLLTTLKNLAKELEIDNDIDINFGGSVGLAIYPNKWNKTQVFQYINPEANDIYYFGDKYEKNGNDYDIINYPLVNGIKVDSPLDTLNYLKKYFI